MLRRMPMRSARERESTIATSARGSLAHPGAVLQPIAFLADGDVWGYEALCRIPGSPERLLFRGAGRSLPPEALLLAEARMLHRALTCRADLPEGRLLTVNISPLALLSDEVQAVFAEFSPLGGIVVELTEHREPQPLARLLPAVNRLREQGAGIALDDVGGGRAGLRYARQLRPDLLKLDRDVVGRVDREPLQRVVLEAVLRVASELDIPVVAEGIERREELDILLDVGIVFGQGFLLGRPTGDARDLPPHVCRYLRGRTALAAARSESFL
jgi:EAL domain-containing protein (putative c-di-GMP-specific phosphodiesterase class I)